MVPGAGLEPAWISPYAPQTYVSASSTTRATVERFLLIINGNLVAGEGFEPPTQRV
jgi:hypothetical protein